MLLFPYKLVKIVALHRKTCNLQMQRGLSSRRLHFIASELTRGF